MLILGKGTNVPLPIGELLLLPILHRMQCSPVSLPAPTLVRIGLPVVHCVHPLPGQKVFGLTISGRKYIHMSNATVRWQKHKEVLFLFIMLTFFRDFSMPATILSFFLLSFAGVHNEQLFFNRARCSHGFKFSCTS